MSDSAPTLGRRDALRAGAGVAAAAAVAAQPAAAQNETSGNETAGNEIAGNETAGNATEPPANETAENESTGMDDSAGMESENETAADGSDGGSSGATDGLSAEEVTAVFLGILATALFSPVLLALLLKAVYEDETPGETTHEYRP